MDPLIKWPGGKSGEIGKILPFVPEFKRYVEPFFGGGAMFFRLRPRRAVINDISGALMELYGLIKAQDRQLCELLLCYSDSFSGLCSFCSRRYGDLFALYTALKSGALGPGEAKARLRLFLSGAAGSLGRGFSERLLLDEGAFTESLVRFALDKLRRTVKNEENRPFSREDLKNNLLTGFMSGYYMYFRSVYNDLRLGRAEAPSPQYRAANFCFIREYCYGSMFRYNSRGEFNIPYGGMSYNGKNFRAKIENMFSEDVRDLFSGTDMRSTDFEELFDSISLTGDDFMFLDPPYDTDFSDYEGRAFTQSDQARLADALRDTPAKFVLVIKNTDFIRSLYKDGFRIYSFDNQYTCNLKSRNDRKTEHLIITNQ